MMLGKRARPPMKRTTSMTEFTFDLNAGIAYQPSDPHNVNPFNAAVDQHYSVKPQRRNSADFSQTPSFLRACCLCKRRLIPGRDIFMYRGDSAFCSLECRQQQMTQDERKENKCSLKNEASASASAAVAGAGESVSAV